MRSAGARFRVSVSLVEVVGRYSNFPPPLLSGQSVRGLGDAIRSKSVKSTAPRIHAIERRLRPETRQQFLNDYQAGVSANQLAVRYGLSRSSVRRLLQEADVPRRYQAMTDAEVQQAVELYQSGLTLAEVAGKLDRPWSTVQTALTRRGGVVMRSRRDYR
jgi:hypothetical protein